ncbi:MAG: hypothetical protein U0821_16020 [Chloroflexota bacterium]
MLDLDLIRRQATATLRLTRDLPAFARAPIDYDAARVLVRHRVEARDATFLHLVERTVFSRPSTPYARLFRAAGCTAGDLRMLVQRDGLESALERLLAAGIYATQAELKGRVDIVRGSLRFRAYAHEFDNPLIAPHFEVPTSGSTGRQLFVGRALAMFAEIGDALAVVIRTFDLERPAYFKWSTLPHSVIENIRTGMPIVAWYNPLAVPLPVRLLQVWFWAVARASGVQIAFPRDLPLTHPERTVHRLASALRRHGSVMVDATSSSATRAAAYAAERGISLQGALWIPWGEPLTRTRENIIRSSGARTTPVYSTVETGPIAMACGRRLDVDAMHVRNEQCALLRIASQHTHAAAPPGALMVTSLRPTLAKILVNAFTGDMADPLGGLCGCEMDGAGLTQRIVNVRSFEKLTGEGITLVGTDLARLIEEDLPATLGGRFGDYQLVETEDPTGAVRLTLRIAPAAGAVDAAAARRRLIDSLSTVSEDTAHMARLLEATAAIQIERARPWTTNSGKIPPFVPLRAQKAD